MRRCTRCLYPENHPLGIVFDEQGVCSGCRVHEEKDRLDWAERGESLQRLLSEYRCRSGRNYDCVVPVDGDADSFFIVHLLRRVHGLNPLLVTYNKHFNTRIGVRNIMRLRTIFGCDIMTLTLDPASIRRITRGTVRRLGSMYWHCLAGQSVFPVRMAVHFKIPLVVLGLHQGCDQVGMFSHEDAAEATRKYRQEHDLMGFEAEDLVGQDEELLAQDLAPFLYPSDQEIEAVGVRGIHLSNYIRWDSKVQAELMIDRYGFESMVQQRTFNTYRGVDSLHYHGIHDVIKFRKWGYGRALDDAVREIRFGRMTREQAAAAAAHFQEIPPRDLPLLLDWLEMEENDFWRAVDAHRDPRAWACEDGAWRLLDAPSDHLHDAGVEEARLSPSPATPFRVTATCDPLTSETGYTMLSQGRFDPDDPEEFLT